MKIKGIVISGMGLGRFYVSKKGYMRVFAKELKCDECNIFRGTLNIKLNSITWRELPLRIFSPPSSSPILYARGKIFEDFVIVLRPEKSRHSEDVVEIVAECNLREKYMLKDGDEVLVELVDVE